MRTLKFRIRDTTDQETIDRMIAKMFKCNCLAAQDDRTLHVTIPKWSDEEDILRLGAILGLIEGSQITNVAMDMIDRMMGNPKKN